MPYIVRNVFLDNEQNFDYIQNQLKKSYKNSKEKWLCNSYLPSTLSNNKNTKKNQSTYLKI